MHPPRVVLNLFGSVRPECREGKVASEEGRKGMEEEGKRKGRGCEESKGEREGTRKGRKAKDEGNGRGRDGKQKRKGMEEEWTESKGGALCMVHVCMVHVCMV